MAKTKIFQLLLIFLMLQLSPGDCIDVNLCENFASNVPSITQTGAIQSGKRSRVTLNVRSDNLIIQLQYKRSDTVDDIERIDLERSSFFFNSYDECKKRHSGLFQHLDVFCFIEFRCLVVNVIIPGLEYLNNANISFYANCNNRRYNFPIFESSTIFLKVVHNDIETEEIDSPLLQSINTTSMTLPTSLIFLLAIILLCILPACIIILHKKKVRSRHSKKNSEPLYDNISVAGNTSTNPNPDSTMTAPPLPQRNSDSLNRPYTIGSPQPSSTTGTQRAKGIYLSYNLCNIEKQETQYARTHRIPVLGNTVGRPLQNHTCDSDDEIPTDHESDDDTTYKEKQYARRNKQN